MYPHCLFFLELLQNANFRSAMAHPGNKELAHRQQFYLWKNYRNNRLKHILPRSLPEQPPASATAPPQPPLPPAAMSSAALPQSPLLSSSTAPAAAAVPSPAPSPMQYGMPSLPGGVAKNDARNSGIDRKRRK